MSATTFSGTEPPLTVGTGMFWIVARSRRLFSATATRIGICRSDRENLALFWSMSPMVATRIVWLSAAVVTPGLAARSNRGLMTISGCDRKSVVEGKSVPVRVDLGGRSLIQKKIKHIARD